MSAEAVPSVKKGVSEVDTIVFVVRGLVNTLKAKPKLVELPEDIKVEGVLKLAFVKSNFEQHGANSTHFKGRSSTPQNFCFIALGINLEKVDNLD